MPSYTGVLLGVERFMASWYKKSQEEASKLREVNRAAKALLANQKTKTKRGDADKEGAGRETENVERVLVVIAASGQSAHYFLCGFSFSFVYFSPIFLFCCLELHPPLLMKGFDLTACLELNLLLLLSLFSQW